MYLLPEGEERSTSAVKQLASIMKAENRTFHSEHVFAISIWDGEGTLLNGHQLLCNEQIHRVGCQELWANHGYRVRQGWSAWSSRRHRHRIGHCHTQTLHERLQQHKSLRRTSWVSFHALLWDHPFTSIPNFIRSSCSLIFNVLLEYISFSF